MFGLADWETFSIEYLIANIATLIVVVNAITFTATIISSFSFHFSPQFIYDLFHTSLTLISFTGTYEPTIDLLPTSVAS